MARRYILHLDFDAFFASVEDLLDPSLRGKPVIVGAPPEQHGAVASASYAARAFGIRSAMPTAQALRLCPQAIVMPPRHKVYQEYSARIMSILSEYTPLIEALSLDEAFLDVTGCEARWGSTEELAQQLQARLQDELGLTASIGLASNKLVAKIASGLEKPLGFVVVPHGGEAEFGQLVRAGSSSPFLIKPDLALLRFVEAVDAVEESGLAGAIRSDNGQHLVVPDLHAHTVKSLDPAKAERDVVHP